MNQKQILLIGGILLCVLGAAFFLERAYFAVSLLDANMLGSMPFRAEDAAKVQRIAVAGGVAFVSGVVITVFGVTKKNEE